MNIIQYIMASAFLTILAFMLILIIGVNYIRQDIKAKEKKK